MITKFPYETYSSLVSYAKHIFILNSYFWFLNSLIISEWSNSLFSGLFEFAMYDFYD